MIVWPGALSLIIAALAGAGASCGLTIWICRHWLYDTSQARYDQGWQDALDASLRARGQSRYGEQLATVTPLFPGRHAAPLADLPEQLADADTIAAPTWPPAGVALLPAEAEQLAQLPEAPPADPEALRRLQWTARDTPAPVLGTYIGILPPDSGDPAIESIRVRFALIRAGLGIPPRSTQPERITP